MTATPTPQRRRLPDVTGIRATAETVSGEPPQFRDKTRAQLIHWIQSLTIESAHHRAGKRYWKKYAMQLEERLNNNKC